MSRMHFNAFVILSVIVPASVLAIPVPLKENFASVLKVRSESSHQPTQPGQRK